MALLGTTNFNGGGMDYMAAQMDDHITGSISENERLMLELDQCASALPGTHCSTGKTEREDRLE
jgi:hypothetical protein